MQWRKNKYSLTDELARLDLDAVCALLHSTYWAATRSRKLIAKSLQYSLNFGLFCGGAQVGFARLLTDFATVGYLCDVIISEEHRGKGIGKWMLSQILAHPGLRGCRIDLFTRSAQDFYRPFGFGPHVDKSLVRYPPDSKRGLRARESVELSVGASSAGASVRRRPS